LGNVLFCLDFADQGPASINAAIANPPSLAVSLAFGAMQLSLPEDNALLAAQTDELVAIATEQGFPLWHTAGTMFRGWVKTKDGDVAGEISLLRSGSATYRVTGAEMWMPRFIALLARHAR
jgi:predicted ATPase